ncbi:(d)CMP kinase [Persephonella sp.]
MIITIDGPAGSGKSTVAKMLSKKLGYTYIDTGAMYRALALKVLNKKIDPEDKEYVLTILKNTKIDLQTDPQNNRVFLDGKDVTDLIRTEEIGKTASKIARYPEVRRFLVKIQRELGLKSKNAVLEGRDAGTVIFPDADIKIFLTASPEIRAKRRYDELKKKGLNVIYTEILNQVIERDKIDQTRKDSPLRPAENSKIIDSSNMSIDEVVNKILEIINN